ncbi:MAG: lipase family protein [Spirochaetales bacterium]|nr:lipase family protein [Spirochaetales bacterium]
MGDPALHGLYDAEEEFSPRKIPELNGAPLLPPDMNYRYFEGISRYPFQPHAKGYSPVNAWILADAAFLSYAHPGFARMAWELAGFTGFHFISSSTMECMIAWNDQAVIVSFRGTELSSSSTLAEVITDLAAVQTRYSSNAYVHKGFFEAFDTVWDGRKGLGEFLRQLGSVNPLRPVWLSGHSLGGALAALCFAKLPQAAGCYVYGAPRVGNEGFAGLVSGREFYRFEYGNDPVTRVPIDIPALGIRYADSGILKYITYGGEVLDSYPPDDQRKKPHEAKIATMGIQPEDHMPINYAVCLYNAMLIDE